MNMCMLVLQVSTDDLIHYTLRQLAPAKLTYWS